MERDDQAPDVLHPRGRYDRHRGDGEQLGQSQGLQAGGPGSSLHRISELTSPGGRALLSTRARGTHGQDSQPASEGPGRQLAPAGHLPALFPRRLRHVTGRQRECAGPSSPCTLPSPCVSPATCYQQGHQAW